MATVPYDHTLTEMLQTAAELIGLKPKEEQGQWVLFLLAEMKTFLPKQRYVELLTVIQESLASQLAEAQG
jgi:hypothetical protein